MIQKNLLKIAKDYYSELKLDIPILDITLTGSLANYNWSKYSDNSLYIIFDANKKFNSSWIFNTVTVYIVSSKFISL